MPRHSAQHRRVVGRHAAPSSHRARRLLLAAPALVMPAIVLALAMGVGPAQAGATATVHVSSGNLNVRSAATTNSAIVRPMRNGSVLDISCKVNGQWINGLLRATAQWDRLTTGGYV